MRHQNTSRAINPPRYQVSTQNVQEILDFHRSQSQPLSSYAQFDEPLYSMQTSPVAPFSFFSSAITSRPFTIGQASPQWRNHQKKWKIQTNQNNHKRRRKRKAEGPLIIDSGNRIDMLDQKRQSALNIQRCKVRTERNSYDCIDRLTLNEWFNRLKNEIEWVQENNHGRHGAKAQPRLSCWACKCPCKYFYGSTIAQRSEYPPILWQIEDAVFRNLQFPTPPDCCFLNYYRSEDDCIGWHQDDEELFDGRNSSICVISLSLGATRNFEIKINSGDSKTPVHSFPLHDGDLCCMSGYFQKYYKHRVPPGRPQNAGEMGQRISLTWRWILQHNCSDKKST